MYTVCTTVVETVKRAAKDKHAQRWLTGVLATMLCSTNTEWL